MKQEKKTNKNKQQKVKLLKLTSIVLVLILAISIAIGMSKQSNQEQTDLVSSSIEKENIVAVEEKKSVTIHLMAIGDAMGW